MATSTYTSTAPDYLDGVITSDLNLFACQVPSSDEHPRAYKLADFLMKISGYIPETAVRIALSRAMEESCTRPGLRDSQEYLQAAVVIIHNYGHDTHRKA